jgi:hypothetical protein
MIYRKALNKERAGVRSFDFFHEPLTLTLSPFGRGEGNFSNTTVPNCFSFYLRKSA